MLQMSQHYEPEFKKKIVRLHLEEGRSLKGLAEEYGVSKASILNILVRAYRCSGGTETANPAVGNRCSEAAIPHLVTSYLCEFTRLKLDLIHILPAWTCNYLGLSG